MRESFKNLKRVVVKAGTSILSNAAGKISQTNLEALGSQILSLQKQGKQVVLVSSGAIAYGMESSKLKNRPRTMSRLQACAAIGQGKLMHAYESYFSRQGVHTAQLLLTRDGLENRKRFLSARNTLEELLRIHVLPVVNENDTVATEEIAFGDNDVLSVQVAHLMHADLLLILSDVDGFFLKDGSRIREVSAESDIDSQLISHLKDEKKETTVGGMKAKLEAARTAMKLGVPLMMVNGHDPEILHKVLGGEDVGTLFYEHGKRKNARKKWIAYSAARKGALVVDDGAYRALTEKQKSLLPGGITNVRGNFETGCVVEIAAGDGTVFGRGVVRYSSRELGQIKGKKTSEIESVLGYKLQDEVIHRNDLILWR